MAKIKQIPFSTAWGQIAEDYDTAAEDPGLWYCPECRESIYEEDYPSIKFSEPAFIQCPICLTWV